MNTLGSQIRSYREGQGLTQTAFSDVLGLSQSFLSRLERGERTHITAKTWDKLVQHVPMLDRSVTSYSETEETYENALLLIGQGDPDQAEMLLLEVINGTYIPDTPGGVDLRNRATLRLAAIRRDQNLLTGHQGAIALYEQVARNSLSPSKMRFEVRFMLAACKEMQHHDEAAASDYAKLLTNTPDLRTKTRLHSRSGALLTKMGQLDDAIKLLQKATKLASSLPDAGPYSYAHEKLGIALMHAKDFEAAMEEILKARTEIQSPGSLRDVQSRTAEASILHSSGEPGNAEQVATTALKLATDNFFEHQALYITNLLNRIRSDASFTH